MQQNNIPNYEGYPQGYPPPNSNKPIHTLAPAMHTSIHDEILAKVQLEVNDILERIEHLIRGDKLEIDSETGNVDWVRPESGEEVFNDYGVAILMEAVIAYINRNTLLSNYSEVVINQKMLDFSEEFSDQIFMQYDKMGLNTHSKRKRYPLIVREVVDMVHSAYLRSLHGEERKMLVSVISINQSQQISSQQGQPNFNTGMNMPQQTGKKFSLLKPNTWVGGR